VNLEAQGRFVRSVEIKVHQSAIGDNLINRDFGWNGVERRAGAESRNGYMQAFGGNPADTF